MNRYILILLGLPFLQLGISYYQSFQILLVLMLASIVILQDRMIYVVRVSLFVVAVFLLKYLVAPDTFSIRDLTVTLREAVCCWLIVLACRSSFSSIRFIKVFNKFAVYFLMLSVMVVFVQFIAIQWGNYVGFPQQWFITNQGTLRGFEEALHHRTRIRPPGYYGEPSYMAFVVLSLFFTYISANKICQNTGISIPNYEKSIAVLVAIILVLLQSLAGVLAFVSLLLLISGKDLKKIWILIFFLFTLLYISSDVFTRIANITEGIDDHSLTIRLLLPQLIIEKAIFFDGNYAGIGIEYIAFYSAMIGLSTIDNALFYLMLHYGVFSLLILGGLCFYLYQRVSWLMVVFFLLAMNFSGGIFTYDKAIIISIIIISIRTAMKLKAADQKPSVQ